MDDILGVNKIQGPERGFDCLSGSVLGKLDELNSTIIGFIDRVGPVMQKKPQDPQSVAEKSPPAPSEFEGFIHNANDRIADLIDKIQSAKENLVI